MRSREPRAGRGLQLKHTSFSKADFGYHIRVPMDEGKARTVAWFKEAGLV